MPRTFDQIVYDVAYATGTLKADVLNPHNKSYDVSLAKALVCYMARMELRIPFTALPGMVGLSDHTAVLKAFNRVSVAKAKRDPEMLKLLELAT